MRCTPPRPGAGADAEAPRWSVEIGDRYVVVQLTDVAPVDNPIYFDDGPALAYGMDGDADSRWPRSLSPSRRRPHLPVHPVRAGHRPRRADRRLGPPWPGRPAGLRRGFGRASGRAGNLARLPGPRIRAAQAFERPSDTNRTASRLLRGEHQVPDQADPHQRGGAAAQQERQGSLKTAVRRSARPPTPATRPLPRRLQARVAPAGQGREQGRHPRQPGRQQEVGHGSARQLALTVAPAARVPLSRTRASVRTFRRAANYAVRRLSNADSSAELLERSGGGILRTADSSA